MNIYFVRTSVWRLNRSFQHVLDAKKYIQNLRKSNNTSKLDIKLFLNGNPV